MHEIRDEIEVALWSTAATLRTERLLVGKPEQQESDVVHQNQERRVKDARRLLEITRVSVKSAGNRVTERHVICVTHLARLLANEESEI